MDAQTPRSFPLPGWRSNKNADRIAHPVAPAAAERRKGNGKSIVPMQMKEQKGDRRKGEKRSFDPEYSLGYWVWGHDSRA